MSLLEASMEEFTFINKQKVPDGYGGSKPTYTEGFSFDASATFDSSLQGRIAFKEGVTSLYTITTKKNLVLEYHDIIKRKRDGKIFRITSDGDDKYSPASSSLNMRQVTAEEWQYE